MLAHRYLRSLLGAVLLTCVAGVSLQGQKSLLNPPGPAPQNVHVLAGSPLLHALAWDRLGGVAGYRVFKTIKGQWYALTQQVILSETWTDTAVVQPGTLYRVSAVYADGRQGDTDFTYANPPQPQQPTGFVAQQVGPGSVAFSWQPVPYAKWYRLFGTGRPAEGTVVNGTQTSLTSLPDGNYTWQVSADYGGSWGPGPSASLTIKSSARYRVVANGFRVINHTNDYNNALTGDGYGDEVYAGFAMFHVSRPQGQLLDQDLRQTVVHGDAGKIPNRVKAGSASQHGGLQNTDVFPPVLDPSVAVGSPGALTFPFLVWDGTLTDAKDAVIILPTLWESDPGTALGSLTQTVGANNGSYTNWFLAEVAELPRVWADPMVQQALQSKAIALTTTPGWTYFTAFDPAFTRFDHPIGSIYDQEPNSGVKSMGKRLPRRALILTREMIEAALRNGSSGIVTIPLMDAGAQGIVGNGHYILYVQVERVP